MSQPPTEDEAQALKLAKRLAGLAGSGEGVVRQAAAEALTTRPVEETAALLHALVVLARRGEPAAKAVLQPVLKALGAEVGAGPREVLRRVAGLLGHGDVDLLLAEGTPTLEYDGEAARRADARLFSAPLGWLKSQARLTKNPDELARLAATSDESVMRELLKNPRLTEALVVRIAARRPSRPEPLTALWNSPKWSLRAAVRRALVLNPYLPVEIGAAIVPLLPPADLRALCEDVTLHAALRQQAQLLLQASPAK